MAKLGSIFAQEQKVKRLERVRENWEKARAALDELRADYAAEIVTLKTQNEVLRDEVNRLRKRVAKLEGK